MASERERTLDLKNLRSWSFLTNYAQVLLTIARNPDARVADIARAAEISERAAYRILADLQKTGYVRRVKAGRRNRYEVNRELPLQDPVVADDLVRDMLALVRDGDVEGHLVGVPALPARLR
jgi:DNA-binding transcriptional ArsR family regulator